MLKAMEQPHQTCDLVLKQAMDNIDMEELFKCLNAIVIVPRSLKNIIRNTHIKTLLHHIFLVPVVLNDPVFSQLIRCVVFIICLSAILSP
jgi:hypothetical protein